MKVYRLTKRKYSGSLDGTGAANSNNRWNSKGTEIIYTSESRALALAEVAVHLPLHLLPESYVIMEILIPDDIGISNCHTNALPQVWNGYPYCSGTQEIGDQFIQKNQNAVLKVPSAVVPGDFNFLINPHHRSFKKIRVLDVTDFLFDRRLFR